MESKNQNEILELYFPQAPQGFIICKVCNCPMIKDKEEICLWCLIHGNIKNE